ncbi:MAG: NAD-dependent epimerase/dehydratase family protein [Butyrivibrio sp.]|nr:NAD-dependent epimerase/dehydratase family protein [Butyrivibrio sp.]
MDTVLLTGSAGFIGFHVARELLKRGHKVIGYDNINDYYDVKIKETRLNILRGYSDFYFYRADLCDENALEEVMRRHTDINRVIHLAAQAGVRYSLICPEKYIESNIVGTFRILELCRRHGIGSLMYASSSSVYGDSEQELLHTDLRTDKPISLYAATKKSDEVLAYAYSDNYKINAVGMRFFTVYGPYGRPDMAYFGFTEKILRDEPIEVYNFGEQHRDFTYIDDLLVGIMGIYDYQSSLEKNAGDYRIFNIGNGNPVKLMDFIEIIERVVGKAAKKVLIERRTGDVTGTYADISALKALCGYAPRTSLEDGIREFYGWYKEYKEEQK